MKTTDIMENVEYRTWGDISRQLSEIAIHHPNDVISNAMSSLAYKVERFNNITDYHKLTETDRQVLKYFQNNRERILTRVLSKNYVTFYLKDDNIYMKVKNESGDIILDQQLKNKSQYQETNDAMKILNKLGGTHIFPNDKNIKWGRVQRPEAVMQKRIQTVRNNG